MTDTTEQQGITIINNSAVQRALNFTIRELKKEIDRIEPSITTTQAESKSHSAKRSLPIVFFFKLITQYNKTYVSHDRVKKTLKETVPRTVDEQEQYSGDIAQLQPIVRIVPIVSIIVIRPMQKGRLLGLNPWGQGLARGLQDPIQK